MIAVNASNMFANDATTSPKMKARIIALCGLKRSPENEYTKMKREMRKDEKATQNSKL